MAKGRPKLDNIVHDHPLYTIWTMIKQRCNNPNHTAYKYYGAKGIKMCEEWLYDFHQFAKDVGERPTRKHSLDRYPDKNGDYKPGNVRWATTFEQAANRNEKKYKQRA